jgi:hypothetical protein
LINWGDGTTSDWLGSYSSGDACNATHVWTKKGAYEITAKARDSLGEESEWSTPLPISMPKATFFGLNILERLNTFIMYLLSRTMMLPQAILAEKPMISNLTSISLLLAPE